MSRGIVQSGGKHEIDQDDNLFRCISGDGRGRCPGRRPLDGHRRHRRRLKPENKDKLTAVLTYHVVPGKVMSSDLTDDAMVATVQGSDVTIDLDNGAMVNDANVTTADIETSNGVIHVIDKVIVPEGVL